MKENGTSNVALGKAIGVSDMAVLRWKKNESSPSLDNAMNIAKYYGVTLDQLTGSTFGLTSNNFFKLPVVGSVNLLTGNIHTEGLFSEEQMFSTNKNIDNYPREECYVLKAFNQLSESEFTDRTVFFVHQQKQCSDGDWVIVKDTDFISEYAIPFSIYSLRKFVRKEDYFELISPNPKVEKKIFRKQEVNYLRIYGVVVNTGVTG